MFDDIQFKTEEDIIRELARRATMLIMRGHTHQAVKMINMYLACTRVTD